MKKFLAALPFIFACTVVQAAPIQISALPSSTAGPDFQHNNFHDGTTEQGTNGVILGWFRLGASGGSWDPLALTDNFQVNIDIFAGTDQGMTGAQIGTAVGTGNLSFAEFNSGNGGPGGIIGSISWDFTNNNNGEIPGLPDATTVFHDIFYTGGAFCNPGFEPNKLCPTPGGASITLWGSDGDLDPSTGLYEGVGIDPTVTLGVDFVATFVPVPAAAWLFGSGLIALVGVSRRKKRHT